MQVTFAITTVLTAGISLYDLKTRRIPNAVIFPAILAGLCIKAYLEGRAGFLDSLGGLLLGGFLLFIPFVLHLIGAGDLKMLAAIGALNGIHLTLYTFLYGAIAGGIIAVGILFFSGQWKNVLWNVYFFFLDLKGAARGDTERPPLFAASGIRFPYGISFFLGYLAANYLMG
ncbi:MAG TPA: prepilin peptidase [Syntrophomonadaceae bacterium]|nr:prepilin peptidase [Syntrophomonadaceae bacterium]